jgi:hypothetical protein
LGELEQITRYIASQNGTSSVAYVDGKNTYLFKALKPLQYIGARNGIKIEQALPDNNQKVFTISLAGDKLKDAKRFGRYIITME